MMPESVVGVLARISALQQVPPAAARFMTALVTASASTANPNVNIAGTVSEALTAPSARSFDAASGDGAASIAAQRAVAPGLGATSNATGLQLTGLQPAGPMRANRALLPAAAQPWLGAINAAADEAGIDPDLLTSLVWTESSFHPDSVSSAGAIGLAQLMPGTAAGLGVDPHDPIANLRGGAHMLAGLIAQFGRVDYALAAYNQGPNAVTRGLAQGRLPGASYAASVLGHYRDLTGTDMEVTS